MVDCYPARVKYRSFAEENNSEGYKKVSEYMVKNATKLEQEASG